MEHTKDKQTHERPSPYSDPKEQDRLWRLGFLEYLTSNEFSVRFAICAHYLSFMIEGPLRVLEIGAGVGTLPLELLERLCSYTYCDLSETAALSFRNTIEPKLVGVETSVIVGEIDQLVIETSFNALVALGIISGLCTKETVLRLVTYNLDVGGVFAVEFNEDWENLVWELTPRGLDQLYGIKIELEGQLEGQMPRKRKMLFFRKSSQTGLSLR